MPEGYASLGHLTIALLSHDSLTVHHIVLPFSLVHGSFLIRLVILVADLELAKAVALIFDPLTLIDVSVAIIHDALALSVAIAPLAIVHGIVSVAHDTESRRKIPHPITLVQLTRATCVLNGAVALETLTLPVTAEPITVRIEQVALRGHVAHPLARELGSVRAVVTCATAVTLVVDHLADVRRLLLPIHELAVAAFHFVAYERPLVPQLQRAVIEHAVAPAKVPNEISRVNTGAILCSERTFSVHLTVDEVTLVDVSVGELVTSFTFKCGCAWIISIMFLTDNIFFRLAFIQLVWLRPISEDQLLLSHT